MSIFDEPPDAPMAEMLRRERQWGLTLDPDTLWPGVRAGHLQRAADVLGFVVAAILRGDRCELTTHGATSAGQHMRLGAGPAVVRDLGVAAVLTGVGPLLGYWIATGALTADEPVSFLLERHLAHGRARHERIASVTVPVLARMSDAGVRPAVIKGFHTAHAYFPDPGTRPFGDVDVVVEPRTIDRAGEVLRAAGFERGKARLSPYKAEWIPPGDDGISSFELWHARNRWCLELHGGLHFTHIIAAGSPIMAARFTESLVLGGTEVGVAGANDLVAMLAIHAGGELFQQRLLRLTEIVLVIRLAQARRQLDWAVIEGRLDEAAAFRFAHPSFALVERVAPGTIPPRLLARAARAASAVARRVTRQLTPTSPVLERSLSLAERLMWSDGILAGMRRLLRMLSLPGGTSPREAVRLYHSRIHRALTSGISVWVKRTGQQDTPDP